MDTFKAITTDRLMLRTFEPRDKDVFFSYRSLPEVYKYQSWRPKDSKEIEDFIQSNADVCPNTPDTWLQVAVCLKAGPLIGDIGLHFLEDAAQAEIGYTVSPAYQGRGYAAEAVKAAVGYLFADLAKHRVTAAVDPDNIKSIRLLEKTGFRKEAHFMKSFYMDGQWLDDCIYAMLRDEWEQAK
jgi:RimJ/RimL family protein N-acetyltransferase